MKENETINRRILTSYQLMLDFYGMRLENESTGLISRSKNYASQYRNLRSTYPCSSLVPWSRPPSPIGDSASSSGLCHSPLHCLGILSYPFVHFVSPSRTDIRQLRNYLLMVVPFAGLDPLFTLSFFPQQALPITTFASPVYSSSFRNLAMNT